MDVRHVRDQLLEVEQDIHFDLLGIPDEVDAEKAKRLDLAYQTLKIFEEKLSEELDAIWDKETQNDKRKRTRNY